MIRIGLLGYSGRMGHAIAEEISGSKACKLVGGVVRQMKPEHKKIKDILLTTDAEEVIKASDVVIDFTFALATPGYAQLAAAKGKPFVSGTTGLSTEGMAALKTAAKKIPLLYAPNTSLSLAVMKQVTKLAAELLSGLDYDIAITDEHHRMKKDMPSGTAKALGEAVLKGNEGEKQPTYASIRAGHIIGNHEVGFFGEGEVIRLHHSVTDRRIFARGAVQAALWLMGKPKGFYSMDNVLGI